jgi:6-phosphofructokinase 2
MTTILTVTMNPCIDVSATVDTVQPVHKLRCAEPHYDPGGGGINVARMIRRFGDDCRALFPAGGAVGQFLCRQLEQEGVAILPVAAKEETRESFTVLETSSGQQYRFVLPGPALLQQEWQACLDCLAAQSEPPRYIVASGSLPPGVPEDFYARLARLATERGARLALDTSGPALAAGLEQGVHIAKPNLRELRALSGEALEAPEAWERAAWRLVDEGKAEIVALSLGEHGAFLASRETGLRAPGLSVEIASAVGAGDSFLGGLVHRLAAGADLAGALGYALASGAAALLTPATELARREDVERLLPQVTVSECPAPDWVRS